MRARMFAILLLFPVLLAAQTRRPAAGVLANSDKLVAMRVQGSARFTPEEITAASGLQLGLKITQQVLNEAAQRLADTGAFKELSFKFVSAPEGTTVHWQITDAAQYVPARFDNFVWFADQELVAKLHDQLPLFKGDLPLGGNLADRVQKSLERLLAARGMPAKVAYIPEAAMNQPIASLGYHVEGVAIRIRKLSFAGADTELTGLLQTASSPLTADDYSRSKSTIFAAMTLLPIYLQRGYLKARFAAPQVQVVETTPQSTTVDLDLPVSQGAQYRLAAMKFTGATVFPDAELQKLFHVSPGKPVNAIELQQDVERFNKPYGVKGHLAARVQPAAVFDDAQATVSYTLAVTEGDVYHFRKLDIQGPDPQTIARLTALWKLKAGDVYDTSYSARFLQEAMRSALPRTVRWQVSENMAMDQKEKAVDLVLRFTPRS